MSSVFPKSAHAYLDMLNFYSQFIEKGDLCFDIGANVGNRTDVFLGLGATVIAVEPQTICVEKLRSSFKRNKNVIIVDKALGEREGFGKIAICEAEPTISTMSDKWKTNGRFANNHEWSKRQPVSITTLDALIQKYGVPKFCKIDVEGFEKQVLKGLTVPIPFISFEFTREFFDDAKKCMAYLSSIGESRFNCSLGESGELFLPEWVTHDRVHTSLDSFDDDFLWGDIYVKFG